MSIDYTRYRTCSCWDDWQECFCREPITLNGLRRAFTCLIRWPFSNPGTLPDYADLLGCLHYSDNPAESTIAIQPGTVLDPGDTENVPGILIQCKDGVQFETPGLRPDMVGSEDYSRHVFVNMAHTTITFLCRHKDADTVCAMCDLVTLFLSALYPRLMDESWPQLRHLQLVSQTEPAMQSAPGDTATKWYEASVAIKLSYEYNVFGARESHRLKAGTVRAEPQPLDVNLDTNQTIK